MVQIVYRSVPSPGKWISDLFGKNMFRRLFDDFWDQHFFEKMNLRRVLRGGHTNQKGSYIDHLAMRFSLKSEFFIWKSHQSFSFSVKPYFLCLQYRKISSKENFNFLMSFWALSSCVAVDLFFCSRKTYFWKTKTQEQEHV